MKKILLFGALVLSLGMFSCQKSEDGAGAGEATVTISATLPSEMASTRAYGDGTTVDRCIMGVYLDGKLYGERQTVGVSNLAANFSVRLVSGKTYDLVFWADKSDGNNKGDLHYDTSEFPEVSFMEGDAYQGNTDDRDAFFGTIQITADQTKTVPVTLHRPFGQLNVNTLDMDDVPSTMRPTQVSIKFESVPTGMNLLTGELTASTAPVSYSAPANLIDSKSGKLSIDYIFAPKGTEQYLADFTMSFLDNTGGEVASAYEFTTIPLQRNYRTIVSGYLLTKKADVSVTVDPEFDGDINSGKVEVSGSQLSAALAGLASDKIYDYNITVTDAAPAGVYTLPALKEGSMLSISLSGADGELTFSNAEFAGLFELSNTTADQITVAIEVPKGDAALGTGKWVVSSVSTKPTTFTVNDGAVISTISVKSGNVVINNGAKVTSVTRTGDNQDASTTVSVFDGADEPELVGENIFMQTGVSGQITIGDKSFATIGDALAAAKPYDVIELAEGSYDLGTPGQADNNGPQGYYLKIDKGITLKGNGHVEIYTSHDANTGNWSLQNLVTVRAENVTIENITFIANYNGYYDGPNKTIEVFSDECNNFTLRDCTLIDGGDKKDAGCLYIGTDTGSGKTATVDGCTFINSAITVRVNTTAQIKNCTFDGVRERSGWNCAVASRGTAVVESSKFINCTAEKGMEPVVANGNGYVVLSGVSFPSDGIYYRTADNGVVNVEGALVAGSPLGFLNAQEKASANDTILLQAGDYDFTTEGTNMVGSSLVVNKAGLTIKALDVENKPVIYASSTSGNWSDGGNVYGQNTMTITADGVTLEDLVIMPITNTGSYTNDYNKAVEVTNTATRFTMKNCEIVPNTKIEGNNKAGYGGQVSINTSKNSNKATVQILNNTFTGVILDPRTAVTATGNVFNGMSPTHKVLCRFRMQYDGQANSQVYSDIEMSGNTYNDAENLDERGVLYIEGALVGIEAGLSEEFDVVNKTSVSDGSYYFYNLK